MDAMRWLLLVTPLLARSTPLDLCQSNHNEQCASPDIAYFTGVYDHMTCCQKCQQQTGCNAWSWHYTHHSCHLHSSCETKIANSEYHSGYGSAPSPTPSPPGGSPFVSLGCHSTTPIDGNSVWDGGSGLWHSCDQYARNDGMKKCIRADGQVDETSLMFDMTSLSSKSGCFVWEASQCGTDMTRVSEISFDFDFSGCQDVWAAPLWITPDNWRSPGYSSGEIDFVEMCPVGSWATNFAGGGGQGEYQMKHGSGSGPNGPKHFSLTFDTAGDLRTLICDLDGSNCYNGAYYNGFLHKITSKYNHHFVSDVWNGYGGDGGWSGCHARHSGGTSCKYAIMNLKVRTTDGRPLYSGKCAAMNGGTSASGDALFANDTVLV
eukprot:TRINITY_DN1422_c0_g1_i4.p1 TRINITY_DN1422_c0_g1~~TRINITY_DN1422_c0_g1_i4.p1  ORF type:complete len:376 (+),score=34.04 TRINITY_DN1422_c0_g1_i4:79-1206(+)